MQEFILSKSKLSLIRGMISVSQSVNLMATVIVAVGCRDVGRRIRASAVGIPVGYQLLLTMYLHSMFIGLHRKIYFHMAYMSEMDLWYQ